MIMLHNIRILKQTLCLCDCCQPGHALQTSILKQSKPQQGSSLKVEAVVRNWENNASASELQ